VKSRRAIVAVFGGFAAGPLARSAARMLGREVDG
jgi:hypothetical protein